MLSKRSDTLESAALIKSCPELFSFFARPIQEKRRKQKMRNEKDRGKNEENR
jgi:hypothetical protein